MSLDRFFAHPDAWDSRTVSLGAEEAHHCRRVLRKRSGDAIEVFDGAGRWARGRIEEESGEGEGVRVQIEEGGHVARPMPDLTLAVAVPKGKTMDVIVQKAVELGVNAIQPVLTARTVVRLGDEDARRKEGKWQRIALEACKQCGQNHVPVVAAPTTLGDWLKRREGVRAGLVASLSAGAVDLREALRALPAGVAHVDLLIGPEGDLSDGELAETTAQGFSPVTFGPLTLRVETAVLFGVSVLNYEMGSE